jgi:hypothetical protein
MHVKFLDRPCPLSAQCLPLSGLNVSDIVFPVTVVRRDDEVGDLKKLIQSKRALDSLKDIDPHTL